jgi:hypothetical protein
MKQCIDAQRGTISKAMWLPYAEAELNSRSPDCQSKLFFLFFLPFKKPKEVPGFLKGCPGNRSNYASKVAVEGHPDLPSNTHPMLCTFRMRGP